MPLQISISNAIGSRGVTAAGGYDPDAQAFITAASITNPTQQSAINQLVLDLKGYSLWTKFKAIYPIVGGSASSHAVNLKTPGTYNMTFATGWTHASTGMTPNGNTYADSNLNINTVMAVNSMAFGVYSRTNNTGGNKAHGAELPGSYTILLEKTASNTALSSINDNGFVSVSVANSDSRGFFQASRTASNALRIVRNTTHATSTAASSSKPNLNFTFGSVSVNNLGAFVRPNDREIAFGYIADGLSQTECSNMYTAVQAYQTTLGRSIGTQTVSDSDAQAFVNAAAIDDQVEANAINNLVIGLKADSLWTKMNAIYPIVGGSASSHAVNLKTPGTFNLSFSTGWTHSSNGALPDGISAYADTSVYPNVSLSQDSTHISCYIRTNNSSNELAIGSRRTGTSLLNIFPNFSGSSYFRVNSTGDAGFNTGGGHLGFWLANRNSSTQTTNRRNSTLYTNNTASNGIDNSMIKLAHIPAFGYYPNQFAFASIGDGLTDTDSANFYTAVQAYQTTLSRQV